MAPEERRTLPGSAMPRPAGAQVLGQIPDDERVEVTVVLQPRAPSLSQGRPPCRERSLPICAVHPRERSKRSLATSPVRASRSSQPTHLDAASCSREAQHGSRLSLVSASCDSSSRADGIGPTKGRSRFRPSSPLVVAVLGLDTRPFARSHRRPAVAPNAPTTAPTVARAYDFPTAYDGRGTTIGFIELGGGFQESDLVRYCEGLGLSTPQVSVVGVDGARNAPTGDPNGPDAEVMLDLEVATGVANGADLVLYMAANTDAAFYSAIATALRDATHAPVAISISWGAPEESYPATTIAAFESVLEEAVHVGVTVLVAAGDQGSTDGVDDGRAHVDYPAASPYVLACGGTRLDLDGTTIVAETVWNDLPNGGATGGGISALFPVPSWQAGIAMPPSANPGAGPGRGVPDVAGNADPDTGYRIVVDGVATVVGGTSAVAPLWAGLVARCHQAGARGGFWNPLLYAARGSSAFHEITVGSNGAYDAGPIWNACCGLGSPNGTAILQTLRA